MASVSPILVTGFRRPDLLKELIVHLLHFTEPGNIYLFVDGIIGAKPNYFEDVKSCRSLALSYELQGINVYLPEKNLGCYLGNRTAISWFFELVPMGIILEDDIWPSKSFLDYCTVSLLEFHSDRSIGSISGTNIVPVDYFKRASQVSSFRLSKYSSSWGWATWADRWQAFADNSEIAEIHEVNRKVFKSGIRMQYWNQIMKKTYLKKVDSWAYRWLFTHWKNGWLALTPNMNLVQNRGFGVLATHTTDTIFPWWVQEISELPDQAGILELLRRKPISPDPEGDDWMEEHHFRVLRSYLRILIEGSGLTRFLRFIDFVRSHRLGKHPS